MEVSRGCQQHGLEELAMATTITLQQLPYFLSAVEHGTLSAAAEAHFIAQPSLSEQIRRLEAQLGMNLFIRTNRKLILTDAARTLIPYAERTIMAVEQLAAAVDPVRNLTGGSVTFGTFSSAHHLLNTDLVVNFHALHPLVRLRILQLNSRQVAALKIRAAAASTRQEGPEQLGRDAPERSGGVPLVSGVPIRQSVGLGD